MTAKERHVTITLTGARMDYDFHGPWSGIDAKRVLTHFTRNYQLYIRDLRRRLTKEVADGTKQKEEKAKTERKEKEAVVARGWLTAGPVAAQIWYPEKCRPPRQRLVKAVARVTFLKISLQP